MKTRTVYKTWAVMRGERVFMTFNERDLADKFARGNDALKVARIRHVAEYVEAAA